MPKSNYDFDREVVSKLPVIPLSGLTNFRVSNGEIYLGEYVTKLVSFSVSYSKERTIRIPEIKFKLFYSLFENSFIIRGENVMEHPNVVGKVDDETAMFCIGSISEAKQLPSVQVANGDSMGMSNRPNIVAIVFIIRVLARDLSYFVESSGNILNNPDENPNYREFIDYLAKLFVLNGWENVIDKVFEKINSLQEQKQNEGVENESNS